MNSGGWQVPSAHLLRILAATNSVAGELGQEGATFMIFLLGQRGFSMSRRLQIQPLQRDIKMVHSGLIIMSHGDRWQPSSQEHSDCTGHTEVIKYKKSWPAMALPFMFIFVVNRHSSINSICEC